jgi:hypothetical protein
MIGQAKSVSHGVNLICYISGEAANKKHPEDIHHVEDRFIPSGLDAQGIYDMMRQPQALTAPQHPQTATIPEACNQASGICSDEKFG